MRTCRARSRRRRRQQQRRATQRPRTWRRCRRATRRTSAPTLRRRRHGTSAAWSSSPLERPESSSWQAARSVAFGRSRPVRATRPTDAHATGCNGTGARPARAGHAARVEGSQGHVRHWPAVAQVALPAAGRAHPPPQRARRRSVAGTPRGPKGGREGLTKAGLWLGGGWVGPQPQGRASRGTS